MVSREYDAVVLGAGIVGLFLASQLAARGTRVAIVDRGPLHADNCAAPYPTLECSARSHQGSVQARHHVVGGNAHFWGGGLIRNRPGEESTLLGDTSWTTSLEPHYDAVERVLAFPCPPARKHCPPDMSALQWTRSEVFALLGHKRNVASTFLDRAMREDSFRLFHSALVVSLDIGKSGNVVAANIVDAEGGNLELVARHFIICMGAIDSVLFLQKHAGGLGLGECSLLGSRLHDHFSLPLFEVKCGKGSPFLRDFAPRFEGGLVVKRHLESQLHGPGWNPAGFLHFQYLFDSAAPYRQLKEFLEIRQRGLSVGGYFPALSRLVTSAPSLIKLAHFGALRKRLFISPEVPIVATFDMESCPSDRNRLTLTSDSEGADCAVLEWNVRDQDIEAFRKFFEQVRQVMSRLATRYRFEFEPVVEFARNSIPEKHFQTSAQDAYHLGGGAQAGATVLDGVLRSDLRLHAVSNVFLVSTAVFRRPGIANPTHTLLALAHSVAQQLAS